MTHSTSSQWRPPIAANYSRYAITPTDRDLARTLDELTFLKAAQPTPAPTPTKARRRSWWRSLTSFLHLRTAPVPSTLPTVDETVRAA